MEYTHSMKILSYFAKNFAVVVGLVLIWRGIWYILDGVDIHVFNGEHGISSVIGIILGFIILYLPDHDLKEIQKL